jgi:cytochrome P450
MLLIGGANRDPDVFEDAAAVRLDREPNPHLGFGFGLHHCLGAPLARLEARIVMRRLLDRSGSFHLADGTLPSYRPNFVLRGLEHLDVTVAPA